MSLNVEYRKVIATNHNASLGINLPKSYAEALGIKQGDAVKVIQREDWIKIKKIRADDE